MVQTGASWKLADKTTQNAYTPLALTEISGMREENGPLVTDELVELDVALGGLGREIRSSRAESEDHCVEFERKREKNVILQDVLPDTRFISL